MSWEDNKSGVSQYWTTTLLSLDMDLCAAAGSYLDSMTQSEQCLCCLCNVV